MFICSYKKVKFLIIYILIGVTLMTGCKSLVEINTVEEAIAALLAVQADLSDINKQIEEEKEIQIYLKAIDKVLVQSKDTLDKVEVYCVDDSVAERYDKTIKYYNKVKKKFDELNSIEVGL